MKQFHVYILASKRNGTLYIGVTSNLVQRIYQHKHRYGDGFTKKYDVHRLVWYESQETARTALARERQIKNGTANGKYVLLSRKIPSGKTCMKI